METVPYMEKGIVIPVHNVVLLPGVSTMIYYSQASVQLQEALRQEDAKFVVLPLKRDLAIGDITAEDFHRYGVMFTSGRLASNEKGTYLSARLMNRVRVENTYQEDGQWVAEYTSDPEQMDLDEQGMEQIISYIRQTVSEIAEHFKNGQMYMKLLDEIHDLNTIIAYLSQFLSLSAQEKYELLETDSMKKRGLAFMDALLKQKDRFDLNLELNEKIASRNSQAYRNHMLREQMKAIQEELDDAADDGESEADEEEDLRTRIENAHLPDEVKKAALKEADRLDTMGQGNAEENIIRNYLDFLLSLPWERAAHEDIDLKKAEEILNARHYGLDKVKERILQHLAVMKLRPDKKGSILLLVGPPGTGKTSLGKSIAEALGRKYVRLSLGGIHDEAEIRGHRRTYIGAMPGNILKSMQKAGSSNPVMVLDEVDKLQQGGYNGDPASALLEVLDPEQNNTFTDHYLDLPYDLSDVFFIATANSADTIPEPLLDRMEVISISGYTEEEKFQIASRHLVSQVLEDHGIGTQDVHFSDQTILDIIRSYTREAGVRGLQKRLSSVTRALAQKIVMGELNMPHTVLPSDLEAMLGQPLARHDQAQDDNPAGVVTGLAWTPVGGEILFIEAAAMPGSGKLTLTGKLGDVMKESAMISLSLLKARMPLTADFFKEQDIHIHVPSGAVPKDGPSAGVTLFTALASLITGIKADPKLAMTGEITLRGAVLPIGGLKEKLLAARAAGIRKVLIPQDNTGDLKDLPQELKQDLQITPVKTVDEVIHHALGITMTQLQCTHKDGKPQTKHVPLLDRGHDAKQMPIM